MYINWNRLSWPILGLQICFRLRRAKNVKNLYELEPRPLLGPQIFSRDKNIRNLYELEPRPLLGLQIFFRLQRAKHITRFLEMYIN